MTPSPDQDHDGPDDAEEKRARIARMAEARSVLAAIDRAIILDDEARISRAAERIRFAVTVRAMLNDE